MTSLLVTGLPNRLNTHAIKCNLLMLYDTLDSNKCDLPHAELLHSQLHAQGLSVFFDAASLRLDEPWEPQIAVAMSSSIVVVLLISHAAVEGTSMRCILLAN